MEKAVYIVRNQAMIRASDVCIFYYNEQYMPIASKGAEYSLKT